MAYAADRLSPVMAAVTFAMPSEPLAAVAACRWARSVHLLLVGRAIFRPDGGAAISGLGGWLLLDPLGKVVLGFLAVLFFLCSLYAPGYLALRQRPAQPRLLREPVRRRWR